MKILYCRVGWMNSYNGIANGDTLINGGSYNKDNIGHEIYNFLPHNGVYYGYVQPSRSTTINIDKLGAKKSDKYLDDILVVWVATKAKSGQYVVGWYKNSRVFRTFQYLKEEDLKNRELTNYNEYSITSIDATLILPLENRVCKLEYKSQSNVWYGNEEENKKVLEYINDIENYRKHEVSSINNKLDNMIGEEKETIIKARINQSKFRKKLLDKYDCCCLCGIKNENLLIASHIKPWVKSDSNEKLNSYNGLLLCAMHDRLFDQGLISFNNNGEILISNELNHEDRRLLNIDNKRLLYIMNDNLPFIRYHRENIFKN